MLIDLSPYFKRRFRKYNQNEQQEIWNKILVFKNDPFDPSLKTHKLKGKHKNYWSFSVNYSLRIIFWFMDKNLAGFVDIGGHEIYK